MINQKDISTWNTNDISNWLKLINMSQYISKFESNKINGYDLIYLTKEDLKSLGILNIHDKNIILNSMKDALLKQLKLNINYKDKNITIQLEFDPNYTVEQLTNTLKLIFKESSNIFLVINNYEILMPNLKIIDLILYNPKVYKNFKIIIDEQLSFNNNNNNNYINIEYSNTNYNNDDLLNENNQINNSRSNQRTINNYQINNEKNYNNSNIKSKKYTNSFPSLDNVEDIFDNKTYLEKKGKKKFNNKKIQPSNEEQFYNRYKTYGDFNKKNDINNKVNNIENEKEINEKVEDKNNLNKIKYQSMRNSQNYNSKNNNNIYEYNNRNITPSHNESRRTNIISSYNNNYFIPKGELNNNNNNNKIEEQENKNRINNNLNLNYGIAQKDNEDNQKYPSEKRNYRTNEINYGTNYGNNLENDNLVDKNNYNYDISNEIDNRNNYEMDYGSLTVNRERNNDRINNTIGYNENKYIDMNLAVRYNKIEGAN